MLPEPRADPRQHCRPLDRNERVRVIVAAEALERRTKAPGARNGALGFHNRASGLCCPSYGALQAATGFCRQSIANALKRADLFKNKVTIELREAAQVYTQDALKTLHEVCIRGVSKAARVAAACAILDRAYGKPKQQVDMNLGERPN